MMRRTIITTALMLALSCPAWAGIMHTPASPAPQTAPTPTSTTQELTAETSTEEGMQDTYTQIALGLLAVLPSLL